MAFKDRLRELRRNKGLTQEEFGKKFNVIKQTVSSWENGNSKPDLDLTASIAVFFGVTLDDLMGSAPIFKTTACYVDDGSTVSVIEQPIVVDTKKLGEYITKLIDDAAKAGKLAPISKEGVWNADAVSYLGLPSSMDLIKLMNGKSKQYNPQTLRKIAEKIGGDYKLMLRLAGHKEDPNEIQGLGTIVSVKELPILGYVPAGKLKICYEVNMGTQPVPVNMPADFCLIVKGDSMVEANIHDGDIVFIAKQNTASNGKMVVARVDGEFTLKKFFKTDGSIVLQPMNSKMPPIIVGANSDVEIIGVVVASLTHH